MISSDYRKKMADSWFSYLQIQICKSFENLENNKLKFSKRDWYKKNIKEGGGTSYLLTKGKVTVNIAPPFSLFPAIIEPPCVLTICLQIDNPKPELFPKLLSFGL